jgi:hypothetical protein
MVLSAEMWDARVAHQASVLRLVSSEVLGERAGQILRALKSASIERLPCLLSDISGSACASSSGYVETSLILTPETYPDDLIPPYPLGYAAKF